MNSCSLEKELRRYYRAVRRRLICPCALRRQTLENLQSNVAEYLESHPGATMADVEAHFGTAESLRTMCCARWNRRKYAAMPASGSWCAFWWWGLWRPR